MVREQGRRATEHAQKTPHCSLASNALPFLTTGLLSQCRAAGSRAQGP